MKGKAKGVKQIKTRTRSVRNVPDRCLFTVWYVCLSRRPNALKTQIWRCRRRRYFFKPV
nr:MAG TPA: hypothetical protein [Caudoviricetes sp.]